MENFINEHKKLSIFIISIIIFYFFAAVPLEKLNENRKNLENKNKRFAGIISSEKIIEKKLENLQKEKEELLKKYSEKKNMEKSYNSLGEFQNELDNLLKNNNLDTLEIGRTVSENEVHRVSYLVKGKEENIINFLLETDKLKNVYILKVPLEFIKEKDFVKLRFGAEIKIQKTEENMEKKIKRKKFMDNNFKNYELIKFSLLGENKGIFYIKNGEKIKRYYFKDGEKENFDGGLCITKVSKEKIVIKNLQNNEKIIFYLGGNCGENGKKD